MPKESVDRSKYIFEHGLVTYVIDFVKKRCWLIDTKDDEDSISALELQRMYPSKWFFRHVGSECEFAENFDDEWTQHVETRYKDYVSGLMEKSNAK